MNKLTACIACLIIGCSCSKPASDLSEITERVLKEDQGITIEFEPHQKIK